MQPPPTVRADVDTWNHLTSHQTEAADDNAAGAPCEILADA